MKKPGPAEAGVSSAIRTIGVFHSTDYGKTCKRAEGTGSDGRMYCICKDDAAKPKTAQTYRTIEPVYKPDKRRKE